MTLGQRPVDEDAILGGRLRLAQPSQGYRVAIDPVFLAASIAVTPGQLILDAGCGSGAAALCLAVRTPNCTILGVERDPILAELARRNVAANLCEERIAVVEQEIATFARSNRDRFDQAMFNPPFHTAGDHTPSPFGTRAVAHGESDLDLDGWIAAMTTLLKPGGHLTLIHRADRLADVLAALDRRFGAVLIFPLWPRTGVAAKRIIVSAVKGRKTPPTLLPGLVLHAQGGAYTAPAQEILRDGAPLALLDAPA